MDPRIRPRSPVSSTGGKAGTGLCRLRSAGSLSASVIEMTSEQSPKSLLTGADLWAAGSHPRVVFFFSCSTFLQEISKADGGATQGRQAGSTRERQHLTAQAALLSRLSRGIPSRWSRKEASRTGAAGGFSRSCPGLLLPPQARS